MRRTFKASLLVFVAALLSLVMAVPANAADSWWDQYAQKTTNNVQYKYGIDYKNLPRSSLNGQTQIWPSGTQPKLPVSPTVNPSATGSSYYLNQARNRVINPANVPLQGKIIMPGQTLVRAPSTYAPVVKAVGGIALPRLLGSLGLGIGGTATPPTNARDIAIAQGVPAACADDARQCSKADMGKLTAINGCGLIGNCDAIGAKQGDETAMSKWFDQSALPFLDDLWAMITGQKTGNAVPPDAHFEVNPRGCKKEAGFEYLGNNTGRVHVRVIEDMGRPTGSTQRVWYDADCAGAAATSPTETNGSWTTQCINKTTGLIDTGGSYISGGGFNSSYFDSATGANKTSLCGASGTAASHTLYKVRFYNNTTQAAFDGSPSMYDALTFSEWVNPDPLVNTTEDTRITTAWDCRDITGTVFTYTKTIGKTSAMVSPDCPLGSELIRHDVKATTGAAGGESRTLDAGAEKPGATAAYPDCAVLGCSLQVHVDGSACAVGRAECQNWPAVNGSSPSRVQCKWGGYTVPTSDCNALSNGYKSETGVVFDPRSGTWVAIDVYGNPIAPNPEPWNPTNPNPVAGQAPGTGTGTGTTPGTGGFPGTGVSPSDNCVSPGWSWNPVEWVKNPVLCALEDAFVPKTDVAGRMAELHTLAVATPPLSWISPPVTGPGGGGCPSWNIVLPGVSQNVVCESSFTHAIQSARPALFGLVATAMVWPFFRSLWYAAIPILRVTPGSSK